MASLKRSFSMLAGCGPDEVALTTNISVALSTIASCLDLSGDRRTVMLSELDFPTDGHVWLMGAEDGRRDPMAPQLRRAPDPVEEYGRAIDERTALVMVNRVLYRSSAIVDAKAVCAVARSARRSRSWTTTTASGSSTGSPRPRLRPLHRRCPRSGCSADRGSCSSMPGAICSPRSSPPSPGWFAQQGRSPSMRSISIITRHAAWARHAPAPVFFIAQGGIDIISEVGPAAIRVRNGGLSDLRHRPERTERVSRCARRGTATPEAAS